MAEGWTQNVRCRYFANGICREGDACRYLHQGEPGPSAASPGSNATTSTQCRFYQRGHCTYGQHCRFSHAGDLSSNSSTNSLNQNMASTSTSNQNMASTSMSSPQKSSRTSELKNGSGPSRKVTVLKKQGNSADSGLGDDTTENWVNAPEFVPAGKDNISRPAERVPPKSYAEVVHALAAKSGSVPNNKNQLCPFLEAGECKYGIECVYTHGDLCELCGRPCLHPHDKEQQKKHINECIKQHEHDMEISFAVARSKDKTCGVCFEVIMEKAPREQRFGILPNCNHCFCLTCIRKWRQAKQFENKIIRACPECRVTSDFVCPSMYWVDTKEDKEKLIKDYKRALSMKDCKYFKSGRGKCPFGNKCFYLHAYPDGTKADVGPPVRHRRHNADGEIDMLQQIILWDFVDERENRWLYSIDELEDLVAFLSDSDDSDWSEYDFFFD